VVRAFKDAAIYHPCGSIDPKRDIDMVNAELIIHDLLFVEKRIERIDNSLKKVKDTSLHKEKALLLKFKDHLEQELPLRLLKLTSDDNKIIASYPLITLKEMLLVLNISDTDIKDASLSHTFGNIYAPMKIDVMQTSAKVEAEIAHLDSRQERQEFLEALSIKENAVHVFARLCMKALGLISFFTIGTNEVRQWLLKAGSTAPVAAGTVHTDMQRGFIRAEVIRYADLVELQNETNVKHAGKQFVKGKDYVVEDGDILNIRFNV
jgi:GTP-binding protein YchF